MKYTAEEVRDYADACRLAHKGPVIADMLTELAERIKVDESAAPVGFVMEATATRHKFGLLTQDLPPGAELFTHPPAQAAQSCEKCKGRGEVFNDVHVRMMTCPHCHGAGKVAPAKPAAQVDPAAKPHTLSDFVHAPDAERAQIGQQVAARVDEMMAEPVAQTARCDKPGCNCATWKPEGCAWDDAEPVAHGESAWLERLKDPATVHALMLRGVIAIPSIRSMVDLRGEVPNGEDVQLLRIAELQEQLAAQPAQSVNIEAIREVIESHINEAKKLRHDPESQDYLYEQADKLEAAIKRVTPRVTERLVQAEHLYRGDCPDALQPESRDTECEACREEDALRAHLLSQDAEIERLRNVMAPKLRELHYDANGLRATLDGGACKALAESFAEQFNSSGAVNYLDVEFTTADGTGFVVTVQKRAKPTAHELRRLAESRLAAADALLRFMRTRFDAHMDDSDRASIEAHLSENADVQP